MTRRRSPCPRRRPRSRTPPSASTAPTGTSSTSAMSTPAVAMDAGGNFVAVWSSNQGSSGNNNYGIYAQRYDSFGNRQGSELHLNSTTLSTQTTPVIAMDGAGNFTVAWASDASGNWDIIARQFDFSGAPTSGEITVNATAAGDQQEPAIGVLPDGRFLIAWRGDDGGGRSDVLARVFDANGAALTGEFVANVNAGNTAAEPAVAAAGSGQFVILWRGIRPDTTGAGVFARLFDAAG